MAARLAALLLALCSMLTLVPAAQAARTEIHPSIAVTGEFNDNVNESRRDTESDFILTLTPGVVFDFESRLLDLDVSYFFDYHDYLGDKREDETRHRLSALGEIRLIQDFLHVEVLNTFSQVYRDRLRGEVGEGETLRDQVDQNYFTVSPYLLLRPMNRLGVQTGYRFTDIWYDEDDGIGSQAHTLYADGAFELTAKFDLTGGYSFTDLESKEDAAEITGYTQHSAYAGFRYEYGANSFVYANAGPTFTDRDGGRNTTDLTWRVGASHDFGYVTGTFETAVEYTDDPLGGVPTKTTSFRGGLVRAYARGTLGLTASYDIFDEEAVDGAVEDDEKRLGGALNLTHSLSSRLTGTLGFRAEHRDYDVSYATLWSPSAGLSYLFGYDIVGSIRYSYIDSYSPEREDDVYKVNRVILSVSKRW
jgi:hypothetical protein